MLRIDDNTFIDTSLITCAEYQLFLDDMWAQGKYFQPDHWAECQFPTGHAHKPLLGMRPSDALAFCAWLTAREQSGWGYRLPTPEEASAYPLPAEAADGLGYWAYVPSTEDKTFIWASVSRPKVLSRDSLQAEMARDRALDHFTDRARALALARDLALDRALDLDRARDLAHDYDFDRVSKLYLARARALAHDLDLARAHAHDFARARAFDLVRAHALARDLDLYVDLLTLRERIQGRLPAFEGIRIVKERKQEKS